MRQIKKIDYLGQKGYASKKFFLEYTGTFDDDELVCGADNNCHSLDPTDQELACYNYGGNVHHLEDYPDGTHRAYVTVYID